MKPKKSRSFLFQQLAELNLQPDNLQFNIPHSKWEILKKMLAENLEEK